MLKQLLRLLLPLMLVLCGAGMAAADVDWEESKSFKTDSTPLDLTTTAKGDWTFVLTKGGKVLVYDQKGELNDTIKVDKDVDSITSDGNGNILYLSSSKNKTVTEILVDYRFNISYDNSPFLGKADAPVVLAAFSDFQ